MDIMVENWVALEEDPEIQESEYADVLETLEKELEGGKDEDAEDKNNDTIVLDDNDSVDDDDDTTIGFKNHFEAEEALKKIKVFAKKSGYPTKVLDHIDHTANGMRVHRVSKKTTSRSILAYFSPSSTSSSL
jgi:predicted AlkP superfamily phosphohydrolase/phosphomutase